MHPEIPAGWLTWNEKFEGWVPFMYLDKGADSGRGRGLVTTAVGDLTPLATAIHLPFLHPDGSAATPDEIAAEWRYVDSRQDLRLRGGMIYGTVTKLRLTRASVEAIAGAKLAEMDKHLAGRFPEWEEWPLQAQWATLSMAWAAGPAVHAPHWEMACRTWDWAMAAAECHLADESNPGLRPRNAANKALFLEASNLLVGSQNPAPVASETCQSDIKVGPAA